MKKDFKAVLKAAENAFKHLHSKGGYKAEDISEKPYQKLIEETNKVFDYSIRDNDVPPEMLAKLQNDSFIFSGLKTHAQLLEASSYLTDKDGKIRSFSAFAQDFNKVNEKYNQNYLEAEHQFAVNSSQMAANWAATDPDGRYNLQYRTANDDRVRENHRALQDITLPKEDSFWLSYYPPNGWRCRCTAVEVRKSKYPESDSAKAIAAGEKATSQIGKDGKNKLEIFRFNPGAQNKVFPPKHPYNKVKGAEEVKKELTGKFVPENISDYEKKLNITVNKDFFNHLTKETPLYNKNPSTHSKSGSGAYYSPSHNFVKIPIDDRRKNSKWYAEAVVYHEFGHAADNHHNIREQKELTELMDKHRDIFKKNKNEGYKDAESKLWGHITKASTKDEIEKASAGLDTLMSLNPSFGSGHTKKYFAQDGKKEAEFIAHAFENTYAGNEIFEDVMPDLYKDMKKYIEGIKPKK
ncbi:phage minor head protein [Chryseobacterium sp.]|uniref:phage head morphogenesis protein n=1 Tax=Chryseobacterium sp. TaxID=1871047 RepID=UPI00289F4966|nr:phage minor head protein [Chryseobacterium sp.]